MDSNGTRYWNLLGQADWGGCLWEDRPRPGAGSEPGEPSESAPLPLAALWRDVDSPQALAGLGWDAVNAELTLPREVFRFHTAPGDQAPDPARRRGACADPTGNIYWLEADADGSRILRQCAHSGQVSHYWPPQPPGPFPVGPRLTAELRSPPASGPGQAQFGPLEASLPPSYELCGLALTGDGRLLAGSRAPAGLLCFDLAGGGSPRWLAWPAPPTGTRPFQPYALAASGGCIWILDRPLPAESDAPARLWRLDGQLRSRPMAAATTSPSQPGEFRPLDPTAPLPPPGLASDAPDFSHARILAVADQVIGLAALPGARALLLVQPSQAGAWGRLLLTGASPADALLALDLAPVFSELIEEAARADFRLRPYALAVQPADEEDGPAALARLLLVGQDGNQAFALLLSGPISAPRLIGLPHYLPMRLFGGRGLVTTAERAWYDSRHGWLPLVAQVRPRYQPLMSLRLGAGKAALDPALRAPLDGNEPGCVWHRLVLDAAIPPGCGIAVEARASDDPETLPSLPWRSQPTPQRRADGAELPWLARLPEAPCHRHRGSFELLFQGISGRWLELRLSLSGDGRATPRLQGLRAWYPRFDLSRYLPAVWRENPRDKEFLDRWLANAEGFFTAWEDRVAAFQLLLDARVAPREYLDWLAAWLGLAFDADLPESRRRLMLRHAHALYRLRGTLPGLQRALRLVLDACPDDRLFAHAGILPERPGDIRLLERPAGQAHRLDVLLPYSADPAAANATRARVERLLRSQLPAHVSLQLGEFDTRFRVGSARLGYETGLGPASATLWALVDVSRLSQCVLGAPSAAPAPHPTPVSNRDTFGHWPGLT